MNALLSPHQMAAALREHEDTLRSLGLKSLAVFGSVARDAHGPDSDVDLLYEFEEGTATLDHLMALETLLEEVLGRKADLVSRKYLSPILRRYIEDDVVILYDTLVSS